MTDAQRERIESLDYYLNSVDLTIETISDNFDKLDINIDDFNDDQLEEIIFGFNHLSVDDVSLFVNPEFSVGQMHQICRGLSDTNIPHESVELFAKPEFDVLQMEEIRMGAYDLSTEILAFLANPDFDSDLMFDIRGCLSNELDLESAKAISDPDLSSSERASMRHALEDGFSLDNLKGNIIDGENKIFSFLDGDNAIEKVSVWHENLTNVRHLDYDDFHDEYYFINTEKGNFELSADLYETRTATYIFNNVDSNDSNSGHENPLFIFFGSGTGLSVLDKIQDEIKEGNVEVEEHSIDIEKKYDGRDVDGDYKYSCTYYIDGNNMYDINDVYSHELDHSLDLLVRFCEEYKETIHDSAERGEKFDNAEDFCEKIECRSKEIDVEEKDVSQDSDKEDLDIGESFDFSEIINDSITDYKELAGEDNDDADNDTQSDDTDTNNDSIDDSEDRRDDDDICDSDDVDDNDSDSWDSDDSVD